MNRTIITATLCICLFAPVVQAQNRAPFKTPQEAVRYYEELVGTLTRQVKLMQDDNAVMAATTQELKSKVEKLESDSREIVSELTSLRKQISADAEVRKAQLNKLADKLSTPAPQPQPKASPATPAPAQNSNTEYVEHTVEPGTTLTALAKAYGVSVSDIIKANKLSKHTIFAGQKLLIPVPKKH